MADIIESPILPLVILAFLALGGIVHFQFVESWRDFCEAQREADRTSAFFRQSGDRFAPMLENAYLTCIDANPYQDRERFSASINASRRANREHIEKLRTLVNQEDK
jgi:hypothetical protein